MAKKPKITAEDFESWRGNAVTEAVMEHLDWIDRNIEAQWVGTLNVPTDPMLLAFIQVELRATKLIIKTVRELQLSDIAEEENADSRDSRIGQIAAKAAAQAKDRAR